MKCPICKKKTEKIVAGYTVDGSEITDGYLCKEGHYAFSDRHGENGGFYVRIGHKEMKDLYAYSVRKCRVQNMVLERWVQRERKRYKKERNRK